MVTLACLALLLIAVALLVVGLRGIRIDDHPLCRRCGYDLTGRTDDATRCAECGADLTRANAIRHGHRVRRRGLVVGGTALLLPAVIGGGVAAWTGAADFDPTPYKPLWWLVRDLDAGTTRRPAALAELARRVGLGRLSGADLDPLLDRALAEQAATTRPWVAGWGTLVEAAHARHQISRERWAAYAAGAIGPRLVARPVVRLGDPLPVAFAIDGGRADRAEFTALFELRDGRLDGRPIGPADPGRHQGKASANGSGCGWSSSVPTVAGSADLPVGHHVLTGTFRLTLYDGSTNDYSFDASTADPPGQLGTVDRPAAVAFVVADAAHVPSAVVTDESKRPAVERAVTVRSIRRRPAGDFAIDVRWTNVPTHLIYRMVVRRPDGRETAVPGSLYLNAMPGGQGCEELLPADAFGSAATVDVLFRPDSEAAYRDENPTPIWGGEVVVRGVPVVRY